MPSLSYSIEYFVIVDTLVMAYPQGRAVDKTDARTLSGCLCFQINGQGQHTVAHQFHHSVIADQAWEKGSQVNTDIGIVEGLEISITREMEEHLDGHNLRKSQYGGLVTLFGAKEEFLIFRDKIKTEIIDGAENFGNFGAVNIGRYFS